MSKITHFAQAMYQQAAPYNVPIESKNEQEHQPGQDWEAPIPFDGLDLPTIDPAILPEPFCGYCDHVSEFLQTPFELVAATVLAVVSVSVQGKYEVKIREGYCEPLNTYWNVPLPPIEKKSPTQKLCKAPLLSYEEAKNAEELPELKRLQSERYTLEKAIEHKRNSAAKANDAETRRALMDEIQALEQEIEDVPYPTRLLADDVTPEALAVIMAQQKGKMAVIEAEATLFDISAGRYSQGTPNFDLLLKSYSVESVRIDRKHGDAITIYSPHLTLCISPQPYVLQNRGAGNAFRGKGLDARFIYLLPKSRVGGRNMEPQPIPYDAERAYHEKIHSLLNIPQRFTEHGKLAPYQLELSPEASQLWVSFACEIEQGLRPQGELSGIQDAAGKLCGNVARIAGLLHCMLHDRPEDFLISQATMNNAVYLGRIIKEHTKAMYELMGEDSNTGDAKKVLQWIIGSGCAPFSARDCLNKFKGSMKKMLIVQAALNVLEERFYIAKDFDASTEKKGAGRPTSQVYKVNPLVQEMKI